MLRILCKGLHLETNIGATENNEHERYERYRAEKMQQ